MRQKGKNMIIKTKIISTLYNRARKVEESYKDVTFIDQNDIGRSTGGSCGVFFSNSAVILFTAVAYLIKFMIYEEHGNMQ